MARSKAGQFLGDARPFRQRNHGLFALVCPTKIEHGSNATIIGQILALGNEHCDSRHDYTAMYNKGSDETAVAVNFHGLEF